MTDPACPHDTFRVEAEANRTVDGQGRVQSLRLKVRVQCGRCGLSLWFPTHATGDSHQIAATTPDGRELTVPMVLVGQRFEPDRTLPGATTRTTALLKGQP